MCYDAMDITKVTTLYHQLIKIIVYNEYRNLLKIDTADATWKK